MARKGEKFVSVGGLKDLRNLVFGVEDGKGKAAFSASVEASNLYEQRREVVETRDKLVAFSLNGAKVANGDNGKFEKIGNSISKLTEMAKILARRQNEARVKAANLSKEYNQALELAMDKIHGREK